MRITDFTPNVAFRAWAAIPFVDIDGRRALTGLQMVQQPQLREFVERNATAFEFAADRDCAYLRSDHEAALVA